MFWRSLVIIPADLTTIPSLAGQSLFLPHVPHQAKSWNVLLFYKYERRKKLHWIYAPNLNGSRCEATSAAMAWCTINVHCLAVNVLQNDCVVVNMHLLVICSHNILVCIRYFATPLISYMSTWQKLNDGVFPTDDARERWPGMDVVPYVHRRYRTSPRNK